MNDDNYLSPFKLYDKDRSFDTKITYMISYDTYRVVVQFKVLNSSEKPSINFITFNCGYENPSNWLQILESFHDKYDTWKSTHQN